VQNQRHDDNEVHEGVAEETRFDYNNNNNNKMMMMMSSRLICLYIRCQPVLCYSIAADAIKSDQLLNYYIRNCYCSRPLVFTQMNFFRRVFRFVRVSIADQWLRLADMSIYFY